MRRLPIYLLVDTSESMRGEPLDAVRMGVRLLVSDLRGDPMAIETAYLSVISFGNTARQVVPLTELMGFQPPLFEARGACCLGAALDELLKCTDRELVTPTAERKGDYKPLVFLMTTGHPADGWELTADKLKKKRWSIIGCAAGHDPNEGMLKSVTEMVVKLEHCEPGTLGVFATKYLIGLFDDGPIKSESVPLNDIPPPPDIVIVSGHDDNKLAVAGRYIENSILADGREVEFVVDPDKPMDGGRKKRFFTPDKSAFVCFYKNQSDPYQRARLEMIVGRCNPTTQKNGDYWNRYFCWPTAIVQSPQYGMGILRPTLPDKYFFKDGPWRGKQKDGTYFTGRTGGGKLFRELLPESERGTWLSYLGICIKLARAVNRLHMTGLSCSDLSPHKILLDPISRQCILLGIDELVVPGIFPPDIMGTPGYMAPEVLVTQHLPLKDPQRNNPCALADQHALAVLIYQLVLGRHPLRGPMVHSIESAEEDELLSMGSKALFIEHPTDRSNRPHDKDLKPTYDALGPYLVAIFNQAFVEGLHAPNRRPIAAQWEQALLKTWDLLHPCPNPACTHKWFVVWQKGAQTCPFCETKVSGTVLKLNLRKEARPGTWLPDGELVVYNGIPIMKWHVFDNVRPDETLSDAERSELLADCQLYNGKWLLINRKLGHMVSPGGNPIPPNSAVELIPGACIRLSSEPQGRFAEVEIIQEN